MADIDRIISISGSCYVPSQNSYYSIVSDFSTVKLMNNGVGVTNVTGGVYWNKGYFCIEYTKTKD